MRARRTSLHPVSVLLCSWLHAACGGDDAVRDPGRIPDAGPGGFRDPTGQTLPPLAYTLSVDYEESLSFSPEAITGHLFLQIGHDGSIGGAVSARVDDTVGLGAVTGRLDGSLLVLQWTDLSVRPHGLLGFDELRLSLLDTDADGAIDGARGEGAGQWGETNGLDVTVTRHESVLIATLDQGRTEAALARPRRDVLLPHDELRVTLGEPLREADVREHLRVRIGEDIVPAQIALEPVAGLVVAATLQPDQLLPFGAELALDLTELTDVAGNQLSRASNSLDVIEDPGPLGEDLGFESGLTGWFTLGNASTQGAVDGFGPAEGATQAMLGVEGTLGAVLELPASATELALSITTLTRADGIIPPPLAVRVRQPGGGAVEFDTTPLDDSLRDCETCAIYEWQNGPIVLTASLEGLEAGPAVLEISAFRSRPTVEEDQVFLIDDIQVR